MVYPQFKRETHVVNVFRFMGERRNDAVAELVLGLDEGTVNDSTCVTPLAIFRSGVAVVLDCLEIDPQKIGQQSPAQASRMLIQFLQTLLKKFPFLQYVPRRWIFECAEGGQMLRLQFAEDSGEDTCLVREKEYNRRYQACKVDAIRKDLVFSCGRKRKYDSTHRRYRKLCV